MKLFTLPSYRHLYTCSSTKDSHLVTKKREMNIAPESSSEANEDHILNCLLKLLSCYMRVRGRFKLNFHDPLDPLFLLSKFVYLMPVNVLSPCCHAEDPS